MRYLCRAKYFDPEQDKMVQNLVKTESILLMFAFGDLESLSEILVLCELVENLEISHFGMVKVEKTQYRSYL